MLEGDVGEGVGEVGSEGVVGGETGEPWGETGSGERGRVGVGERGERGRVGVGERG